MPFQRSRLTVGALAASAFLVAPAFAADIIVSAQDGKFVRVEGRATFPQPAPPDSLVVIDVFSQDSRQILLQMDVERALGVYAIRDGKLADTGTRIPLAAGPVSIRSMPR